MATVFTMSWTSAVPVIPLWTTPVDKCSITSASTAGP